MTRAGRHHGKGGGRGGSRRPRRVDPSAERQRMSERSNWVMKLPADRLLAFAERLKEKRRAGAERPLEPLPRPLGPVPLSFAQERLWFLDRLAPASAAYNIAVPVRLSGRLSAPVLAASLGEVVRRHEVLRTRFVTGAEGPLQIVDPPAPVALPRIDLRTLPPEPRAAEVAALAAADARRPFELAASPMLRATLLALGEDEHAVLLTMHHIASDAWSAAILIDEVSTLYAAFLAGRPSPLPPLALQYADYAAWKRGGLTGEALEAELRYWRETLAGAPVVLALPTDRPAPAASRRGGRRTVDLGLEASAGVRELARQSGATLFMVGLAAFQALLHRITGQPTLLVGSTFANRTRGELEGMIGFFINTLALRSDLAPGESFRQLLADARERTLAAQAHQEVPFERLVEMLVPERDPRLPPLVQVMLQARHAPAAAVALPGLKLAHFAPGVESAKLDLVVNLVEDGAAIGVDLLYSAELFDVTTVDRLLRSFAGILRAVSAAPALAVADLPLLSPAERHELLAEWAGAGDRFAVAGSLHEVFAGRAAQAPGAIAVVCGDALLTYGELDRRSDRLASRLLVRGAAPGSLVGLCLERSVDLVVAILAVLKAGCAYVPLDPAYPAARLAFLLADSRAAVLLTRRALAARLPASRPPLVLFDGDGDGGGEAASAGESAAAPCRAASPRDLAYALYTSGSTGQPKGVLVEHGHVLRLFAATAAHFDCGADDVWSLFHSYAFDFSVWELWGALLHGGRLVVVPRAVARSPGDFYQLLRRERVTVLSQTPAAFRQLVWAEAAALGGSAAGDGELALRYVVFGGEALEPAALAPWLERHGAARPALVNLYGITETTVHATHRRLGPADLAAGFAAGASPIGRPLPDLALYLVDAALEPVAIGVPGEILIGGAGVARGYLGRPELTAERFVPDPFAGGRSDGEPGARLYRSGDLARWLPEGELAFLGRLDLQVKVRGFRVELGEIQAALLAHPAVRNAAVLALAGPLLAPRQTPGEETTADGGPREQRIVAYLVVDPALDPARAPSPGELRRFLAATLPEHMLPAAYVTLPALPLTPHGKVDRRALAGIDPRDSATRAVAAGSADAPPRDDLERFLAGLFREALKVERVGIHDGFFALGGNSIAGAVLVQRLQQELGELVQVVVIFDAPSVALLADHLRREHPAAVARRWGGRAAARPPEGGAPVDEERVAAFRRLVRPLPPLSPGQAAEPRNPRALFVLAPPRSGTTLLRVMLGGHPRLFAPPELELLSFNTLAERRAAFAGNGGRDRFWLEGAIRAVMEARGCPADEAEAIVETGEREGWSTRRLYAEIQGWTAGRMLVDKTPSYALDPAVLARAEEAFEAPLYIHLVRHPYGMIHSFEEAKLDQLFFRHPHRFGRRELAELVWLVSQRNILDCLAGIPAERQRRVAFEELLARPAAVLGGLCDFLGLRYHPDMAEPYRRTSARMTDGPHAASRMLGDVKFHQHRRIDAGAAERWREAHAEDFLGEPARALAAALGYGGIAPPRAAPRRAGPLVAITSGGGGRPFFGVHPVGGNVLCYAELARQLGRERPFYGLQALGVLGEEPQRTIEAMAATYLAAIAEVDPRGPYLLGGWSLGGVIAYEMALQAAGRGLAVQQLVLIDSPAPGAAGAVNGPGGGPADATDDELAERFVLDLAGLSGADRARAAAELRALPASPSTARLDAALALARRAGALPAALSPEQAAAAARRLAAVFAANFRALRAYAPRPYSGRVVLFRAAERSPGAGADPALGWGALAGGGLAVRELPGDHYSLLQEPRAAALAAALSRILDPLER